MLVGPCGGYPRHRVSGQYQIADRRSQRHEFFSNGRAVPYCMGGGVVLGAGVAVAASFAFGGIPSVAGFGGALTGLLLGLGAAAVTHRPFSENPGDKLKEALDRSAELLAKEQLQPSVGLPDVTRDEILEHLEVTRQQHVDRGDLSEALELEKARKRFSRDGKMHWTDLNAQAVQNSERAVSASLKELLEEKLEEQEIRELLQSGLAPEGLVWSEEQVQVGDHRLQVD